MYELSFRRKDLNLFQEIPHMNAEIAKAALAFLGRANLQGNEVPAFNMVSQALIGIIQAEEAAAAAPAPEPAPEPVPAPANE